MGIDKEVLSIVLGFFVTLGGGIRWLLQVYFDQQKKIEDLRTKNEKAAILAMKDSINDLKRELDFHRKNLKSVEDKIAIYIKRADSSIDDQRAVIESMQVFIDTTIKRIHALETKMVELANGLVLVKGSNANTKRD